MLDRKTTFFGTVWTVIFSFSFCSSFRYDEDFFDNRQVVFLRPRIGSGFSKRGDTGSDFKLPADTNFFNSARGRSGKRKPIVTETNLGNDTHLTAVVTWTHFDSRVIFIITCDKVKKIKSRSYCLGDSNVYRSINFGKSFNLESSKFDNTSQISIINISPRDRRIVFAQDQFNKKLYISFNEGDSYVQNSVTFSPTYISFHSVFPHYLLIKDTKNDIYFSNNTGENWYLMLSNIRNFFWSVDVQNNRSKIFFEKISQQNTKLPTYNYSIVYVAEEPFMQPAHIFDQTLGLIFPGSLLVRGNYIFIQRKTSAGNRRLFMLHKITQEVKECEFPTSEPHVDFHFLGDEPHQILLAALTKQGITNLYVADKQAKQFFLILEKVEAAWKQGGTIIDVHRVTGVPGTFIANKVGIGTVISHNNGGMWNRLKLPDQDDSGKELACYQSDCIVKLSLYIQDNFVIGWSPVTSSKYVPGVVIAQGTILKKPYVVGKYPYGFLSIDGGQSWSLALKGRHIYKLLDHGGMFASVPITNQFLDQKQNQVQYSCNNGFSWDAISLNNQVSAVVGVAAHPAAKSNTLKIFGADLLFSKKVVWTIWHVNFSSIFDYKCSPNNFSMWVAGQKEGSFGSCILGQKFVYERRTDGVCCSYGVDFKRRENITLCECTMNDFECDFGFKRETIGSLCIPTSFASLNPPVNCPEGGSYLTSKGYRKIKGDACQGGIEKELLPVPKKCPAQAPDGISLSVQKYSIALGTTAKIELHQQSGFLETVYTWDYGDGFKEYNLSFSEAARWHKYEKVGTYIISVLASNSAGSFTAKTVMRVIERVSEVFLYITKPVVASEEATYTAELITHNATVKDRHGFVHFAWIFEPIKTPVLSLNSSVKHTYDKPGTYEVEVRVFNAISVVSTTASVTVFGDVRVLKLQFSSTLDLLNRGTKAWNKLFTATVSQYLIKMFKIRKDMVIVDVSKTLPTIVTLSLVQNTVPEQNLGNPSIETTKMPSSRSLSIDIVMHKIISSVRNQKISFFWLGQEIRVLKATIIRDKKTQPTVEPVQYGLSAELKKDLYIGVSIGVILVLICAISCFICCRRRKHCCKKEKYLVMQDEISVQGDCSMNDLHAM